MMDNAARSRQELADRALHSLGADVNMVERFLSPARSFKARQAPCQKERQLLHLSVTGFDGLGGTWV
jgi:hypothetical protein